MPKTHKLVPIEPTDEQWQAAFDLYGTQYHEDQMQSVIICIKEMYKVMIASAPEVGEAVATKADRKYIYENGEEPGYENEPVSVLAIKNAELNKRIEALEDLLSSAYNIANRNGKNTHWFRFAAQLHIHGINPVTAKTFKILPSDECYQPDRTAQIEADNKRLVEALKEADELIAIEPYEHVAQEAADAHRNIRALLADMEAKGC